MSAEQELKQIGDALYAKAESDPAFRKLMVEDCEKAFEQATGLPLSLKDLEQATAALAASQAKPDGELDDEQLEAVAGGFADALQSATVQWVGGIGTIGGSLDTIGNAALKQSEAKGSIDAAMQGAQSADYQAQMTQIIQSIQSIMGQIQSFQNAQMQALGRNV